MDLGKLAELSIGLAATIGVLWIVLQMMKEIRKGKPEGENGHSGSKPVSYWQMEFRKAIRDELTDFDRGRMERIKVMIREAIREELDRE